MNKITGNEQAVGFGYCTADGSNRQEYLGMTIRQYYAGLAMQGILAGVNASKEAWADYVKVASEEGISFDQLVSKNSVEAADALIAELNKTK